MSERGDPKPVGRGIPERANERGCQSRSTAEVGRDGATSRCLRQNASNAIVVLLETSAIDEAKMAVIPEIVDKSVTADEHMTADPADTHVASL